MSRRLLWVEGPGTVRELLHEECQQAFAAQREVNAIRLHPVNESRLLNELADAHILTPEMVEDHWVPDPITGKRLLLGRDIFVDKERVVVERV